MRPNESILRDFLGISVIAQKPHGQGEDPRPVAADNLDKRRLVTASESTDEFAVDGGLRAALDRPPPHPSRQRAGMTGRGGRGGLRSFLRGGAGIVILY